MSEYKEVMIGPKKMSIPEDWNLVAIEKVAEDFISGGTPDTNVDDYWEGDIPWTTNAYVNGPFFSNGKRKITEKGLENSSANVVPKGNLLFGTRVNVGNVALNEVDMAISQDITGILLDKEGISNEFVMWFLYNAEPILRQFEQGSTIKGMLVDDLKKFEIPLPPLPEQRRIAEILSTVDDTIQKTDEVIEKAERLKKGLMQDLLTKGIGHDEFKEVQIGPKTVEIPEKWNVERLEDACQEKPKYGANSSSIDYDDSLPRYIRITDISEDGHLKDDEKRSIPKEEAKGYFLEENNLVFARSGATVGKTYLYDNKDGKCAYAGYLIRYKLDPNIIFPRFAFYYTHSWIYYSWVKSMIRATSQPNINSQEYSSLKFVLPPLSEQKEIANIIDTLDNKIQKEKSYKEKLEKLKKGLMQDLLTGKVRLNV